MNEHLVFGKGISFPPRLAPDGRVAWSSGPQNIREMVRVILLTELNERLMMPEFGGGLNSFLVRPNTVATHRLMEERVTQALTLWEPRISLESVTVRQDPDDQEQALVTVNYRFVATGRGEQVSLTVNLSG